jgi:hypothetical protein
VRTSTRRAGTFLLASLASVVTLYAASVMRPTADSDPGEASSLCTAGTNAVSAAMPESWDADENTFDSIVAILATSSKNSQRLFSGFGTLAGSDKTLIIKSQHTIGGGDGIGSGVIEYSLNAGGAWTTLFQSMNTGRPLTTDTITLPAEQDVSQIQVRACVTATSVGNTSSSTLNIYDIRAEATSGMHKRRAIVAAAVR